MIINKDCLEALKELPDNSIDSIVTDPPYGLSFMGKKWDYDVPSTEIWSECLRVLKPGGYLLAFAGTRTQHRMAVRIEDAGFEIRDMIAWVYGSGFPKSLNIGKAVDKLQGNERIKTGEIKHHAQKGVAVAEERGAIGGGAFGQAKDEELTKGTSEWEGWGTALKPALEPITVARKPIEGTVAENCLKWGVGGINIDGSRVEMPDRAEYEAKQRTFKGATGKVGEASWKNSSPLNDPETSIENSRLGRFPANLIHDNSEEVRECFPETKPSKIRIVKDDEKLNKENTVFETSGYKERFEGGINDNGGNASRFFKSIPIEEQDEIQEECTDMEEKLEIIENWIPECGHGDPGLNLTIAYCARCYEEKKQFYKSIIYQAKASKSERNKGCEGLEEKERIDYGGFHSEKGLITNGRNPENRKPTTNNHPTVKPIKLMEYLVNLVSKPGHTVLDPFCGSGTTGIACKKLNRNFIGIERDEEYCKIAEARINNLTLN